MALGMATIAGSWHNNMAARDRRLEACRRHVALRDERRVFRDERAAPRDERRDALRLVAAVICKFRMPRVTSLHSHLGRGSIGPPCHGHREYRQGFHRIGLTVYGGIPEVRAP